MQCSVCSLLELILGLLACLLPRNQVNEQKGIHYNTIKLYLSYNK
jgi:hypothetical protein